ncbi:MAG: hypothetical protein WCA35_26760, partial [Kovacikia sp.]
VHLGETGIQYNIRKEMPFFFSLPPLATTLCAGTVPVSRYQRGADPGAELQLAAETKQVQAIDLNVLARDFLVAVEAFLDPAIVLAAKPIHPDTVHLILEHKETLADAIQKQVTHLLEPGSPEKQRAIAADLLKQQLLINLVNAYDIETIIQYSVDVSFAHQPPNWDNPPRLVGQPVIQKQADGTLNPALRDVDFVLSSAKVPLDAGTSYLTFFFDTKTPKKLEHLALPLLFRINELEHDIVDVNGINNYQASSWLSFVLPIDRVGSDQTNALANANLMGDVTIPVPLRSYPMPPSLVLQRAEPDPDSLQDPQKIREWQYTYVYEHLDVAQDAIVSTVRYNAPPPETTDTDNVTTPPTLFTTLVDFALKYPQLLPDLQTLTRPSPNAKVTHAAISAFETLVGRVADAWKRWQLVAETHRVQSGDAYYVVNEAIDGDIKTVAINREDAQIPFPTAIVPGYALQSTASTANTQTYSFQKKSPEDAARDPVFGESAIPDRILSIPDLDIIQQQSAWGAIWLTRNQQLLPSRTTNPLFVYQTPIVRFRNSAIPLLVNAHRWDIAILDIVSNRPVTRTEPISRPLADHLSTLFATLLPQQSGKPYDLRITCRYAFALAVAPNDQDTLLSTLPVLLGPRVSIPANQDPMRATNDLRSRLNDDIKQWLSDTRPNNTNALLIFSVSIFTDGSAST